ncbi:MAG: hypothetical protein K2P16_01890 [Lawsonibacter sp.]|nr:hypothetical protein [Lawsonibacter sp.]MDE6897994.1 hypothetical protein [Lawsonibacter sp.]
MSDNYTGKRSAGKIVQIVLAVLACLALAAAGILFLQTREREPAAPKGVQVGNNGQPADSGAGSSADSAALSSQSFDEVPPAPAAPLYDFSQPAPEGEAVDNSYFADAAFVGDSRTDGFMLYSGVGCGKNLTSNGLSIFKLAEKKVLTIGGEQYTLLEALALEEYGKVYLSLGVNELGLKNDNGFYESYCEAIDAIRLVQPGAVIYIQGLIPLNEGQIEEANGNKYNLTNDHLRVYNDLMRRAAEEKQVVFLDLYAEFVDENGALPEDVSRDGVHLYKEACQRWLEYLKTHTVDFDVLYPDGPPVVENTAPEQTPEDGSGQE